MEAKLPQLIERCLAIDLHKHYLVIAGVNREQEVVLEPRRMDFAQWLHWVPVLDGVTWGRWTIWHHR